MLRMDETRSRGILVLACEGELVAGKGEKALVARIDAMLERGDRLFVLDLLGLRYLDSAGIGAIVASSKHCAERGAILKIAVGPTGAVRRVFDATGLDRAFEVFETRESAVDGFKL